MARLPRLSLLLIFTAGTLAFAAEPEAKPQWPLWDGQESIEQYAQRANLPPTKALDLGNGVKLELVLIPAGEFRMGTPEPVLVKEIRLDNAVLLGQVSLAASSAVLLVLLGEVAAQSIRKRRRPQFSLARFLLMIVAAGGCVLGGAHWWQSARLLEKGQTEYRAEQYRYMRVDYTEKPAHKVTLTTPFYMGKYDVMQEQYQQVIGANPSNFKGKNNPVEMVSWDGAQDFCKKLTEQTTQAVRLPTEAEWEYACRAGTTTAYHSGDTEADLARVAWYSANSKETTHPVGQKEANAFGLYDMHGNVGQWCQDWYDADYYGKSVAENPPGPAQGTRRVLRGGSWGNGPGGCRSAGRSSDIPDSCRSFGFRVAVSVAPKAP